MRAFTFLAAVGLLAPAISCAQTFTASKSALTFTFPQGGQAPDKQVIMLSSTPSPANYSLVFTGTSGGKFVDVTPVSGSTPAMLTAQLDPFALSLTAGTYTGNIVINQTFNIPVTLVVTTALNPSATSLTFSTQQVGTTTPAPPAQTFMVTSPSPVPFTSTASSPGNWLGVSQSSTSTPANVTATINPAGLGPGTFMGTIALASPNAQGATINVTLTILPPLIFTFTPSALNFLSTSANPQPAQQTISVFSNLPSPIFASASTTTGGNWLALTQSSTQTPTNLAATVNLNGLNPGTYTGQINLASSKTAAVTTSIPVTFTIAAPQAPTLQVSPDTLSFSSAQGGLPIQQQLAIFNTGGGSLNYSAQVSAISGGNWLTLQSPTGTATAASPGEIPFTISPGSLAQGTYSATVTVTAGSQTATVTVILAINSAGPSLLLSQTGLTFQAVAQGSNPPAQTVSVVNTGAGALNWNATASTLSGGNWLSVSPSSGTTQPLPATPPNVTISVNSQNLAAGTYYGTVKVNSQAVAVQIVVLPVGQIPNPSISADGLVFTTSAGGTNPAPQTVTIISPLAYTAAVSTNDGASWLSTTQGASSISVQATIAGLTAGIRYGTINLAFADGSFQTINVVSVVAPAGTAAQIRPNAVHPDASGCGGILVPQVTSLSSNFSTNAGQSAPLTVSVVDDCGHVLPNTVSSSVIASFYDATKPPGPTAKLQPDQRLTPQGNGVWAGTWTPIAATSQLQLIVVALGINGTTPVAGQVTVKGTVRAAGSGSPAIPTGIFNAASYQPGNTVALGSFVSIFGLNLANGSGAPNTQPLPTSYQGTQVFLGGVALPLQYAGPNQINALIPANVAVNSQQPLIVQRDVTEAAPTSVTIADAQPGIYTANQQGTGQGAVLTSDNQLDAPTGAYPGSHPATRGDFIEIFCTGLGAVTNPPPPGAAAPNSPLSYTVSTVTATIGGVNAPVIFAGLAPGFIGLYQVNVTIPTSVAPGGAVPLTLTVGSATSNTATIAIQ